MDAEKEVANDYFVGTLELTLCSILNIVFGVSIVISVAIVILVKIGFLIYRGAELAHHLQAFY